MFFNCCVQFLVRFKKKGNGGKENCNVDWCGSVNYCDWCCSLVHHAFAKIDEDITIDGPANVQTIGNAYTLVDLHSVSALWSGSTVLTMVVIFSLVACCCKNKALARIHNHVKEKFKDEFVHLNSEFRVECRPDPSNPTLVKQEAKQVGFKPARSVMDIKAKAEERALVETKVR